MFTNVARRISDLTGSPYATAAALIIVMVWALCGPIFNFSSEWQLIINTFTTVITFLMVFFIQHAQDVDTRAIHIKLDEIILSMENARDEVAEIEQQDRQHMDAVREKHHTI